MLTSVGLDCNNKYWPKILTWVPKFESPAKQKTKKEMPKEDKPQEDWMERTNAELPKWIAMAPVSDHVSHQ